MSDKKQEITFSKKQLGILITVVVLLLVGAVTVGLNWNNWFAKKTGADTSTTSSVPDSSSGSSAVSPDIDPNAGDYTGSTPSSQGGASTGIKIPGYPSITVAANTKNVTMALLNPEGNPCYFSFEIVLNDTGKTIYQSKMVPPGKSISAVTLTEALSPGEHKATIKISTASLSDLSAMNGANVETVLIAK